MAAVGKKYHNTAGEMLWDLMQLIGQADLQIRETREARLEEYLTPSFKATLKSAGGNSTDNLTLY